MHTAYNPDLVAHTTRRTTPAPNPWLRFLNQGNIRQLYHHIEKDDKKHGCIFIRFRFK